MGSQADPLDLLRPLMDTHSPLLHALVVPSEDSHQSEYVADADKRREFVSGFNGSAGIALITKTEALLWTDGRYFLQASQQLSTRWKLMRIGEDPPLENWLAENVDKGANVGIDPSCISIDTAHRWEQAFSKHGQKLVPLKENLVDKVWDTRPPEIISPIFIHPLEFTGRTAKEKITELREKLSQEKAFAIVVSTLDEVAWLYNLRGGDVLYNPVVHAYLIVTRDSAFYYVNKVKVDMKVEQYLFENGVEIREYDEILQDVETLASGQPSSLKKSVKNTSTEEIAVEVSADKDGQQTGHQRVLASTESDVVDSLEDYVTKHENKGGLQNDEDKDLSIWIDPGTCSYMIYCRLPADRIILQQSPIAMAKALKHPVELEGMRNAHIRDGAAVVSYLAWLDAQMQDLYGAAGYFSEVKGSLKRKRSEEEKLTEVTVADKLHEFRAKQEYFKGLSFETISSVGGNAAIIHYAAKAETCAEMQPDSMYLCDSGGRFWWSVKYLDGTTDITRTMHFGKPTAHEKACATLVLKGHIALDMAVFPNGTTGHALDILARVPLWKDGLDYRHGTGHGVGCYLNVHEGDVYADLTSTYVTNQPQGPIEGKAHQDSKSSDHIQILTLTVGWPTGPHLISFRPQARNVALQATMTVTDEPGYYEDGNFGVRIENVLIVKEAQAKHNFGEKGYLAFEHITWTPYQTKLMDLSLMSEVEKDWVDDYHVNCREKVGVLLSGVELEWLIKATEPLPR